MSLDQRAMTDRLQHLCDRFDVPGAVVGLLVGDEVTTAAVGVLNRHTGVETTTDSLFQIGSITKVYTASLVQRLVEGGQLDLDVPVRTYLPDFKVADAAASETVTLRHLLTHTSGIDGDHFEDTGRGDDALDKYVASCTELAQLFPVGETMSYCNAGFSIIGRVLEQVTGNVWDQVLRDELVTPLGVEHTLTLPEEVLRFRAACGHVGEPGSRKLTPQWGIPRSAGPPGGIIASAADVLAFAKAFIDDGRTADGAAWLSEAAVDGMLQPQVEVPSPDSMGGQWGVGWALDDEAGMFGHDGGTFGQCALLRIVPDRGVAVVLLLNVNGGGVGDLSRILLSEVLSEAADVTMPPRPKPVVGAIGGDRSTQVGRYVRAGTTVDIEEHGERGLEATLTFTSELGSVVNDEPMVVELLPVEEDAYVGHYAGEEGWTPVVFLTLDDGSRLLHVGHRATPRIT